MPRLRALAPLALLIVVAGCDAGITSTGGGRIVAFTPNFPDGLGCAVYGDGSAICRGGNDYGFLGIGTAAEGSSALANQTPVETSARFRAIAVGDAHACALDGDGAAWCWGSNQWGQLGVGDSTGPERCDATIYNYPSVIHGSISCATRPVRVATSARFRTIQADYDETCALTGGGELWCWGNGYDGFGLGGDAPPAGCAGLVCGTPIRAAPGLLFQKFSLQGGGTCAIGPERVVYCWGSYAYDRFGRDTASTARWDAPTPINSTAAVRDLAVGQSHTCAITTAGALLCFGANGVGQLGDGTTISRTTPMQTQPQVPFVHVAVANGRSCALDTDGKAWCWGSNGDGGLGVGTTLPTLAPAPVLGGLTFTSISLGGPICGTQSDGIWCWGQLPSRFEQ